MALSNWILGYLQMCMKAVKNKSKWFLIFFFSFINWSPVFYLLNQKSILKGGVKSGGTDCIHWLSLVWNQVIKSIGVFLAVCFRRAASRIRRVSWKNKILHQAPSQNVPESASRDEINEEMRAEVWFPRRISWFTFIKSIIATIHHTWCFQKTKTKQQTPTKEEKKKKTFTWYVCKLQG